MAAPNTRKMDKIESNELYNTPQIALESFYNQFPEVFEDFNVYYDPCNGLGAISDFLKSIGKKVYTNDLVDYGTGASVGNFLEIESLPDDVDCIIHNPPFTLTEQFVDHSLKLCDNVLMFNRMVTIESNKRASKLKSKKWPLTNMWQFGFRVSCSKGVDQEPTSNSVAYSWFEFNKGCTRKTELDWITKEA